MHARREASEDDLNARTRMTLILQKYGGTSVGSSDRIREVAARVVRTRSAGARVVVVVSAMGHATDELVRLAEEVTGRPDAARAHPREMDMLLSAGERISMALLTMAIRELGVAAISLTGSQAAIITDDAHTAARITEIRAERVREALEQEAVVIVAGFQGVSRRREVTTLGRGGSDTTAVALAAALGADRCEILSDVAGIFTADPRYVPEARVIPEISYEEMMELASAGAQVMHPRAVEIASKYGVELRAASSFDDADAPAAGTLITRTPRRMEELYLTGIAARDGQARLVIRSLPAGMRSVTAVLVALAEAGVSVDMVTETSAPGGGMNLQLTVDEETLPEAERVCSGVMRALGGAGIDTLPGLTRVALVGSGMNARPGVYARAFRALLDEEVDVFAVSTSGITITLLVPTERKEDALRALHHCFEMELVPLAAVIGQED